jgi:DNA helicase HerA-like ATPase
MSQYMSQMEINGGQALSGHRSNVQTPAKPPFIGKVTLVRGAHATLKLSDMIDQSEASQPTVATLLGIHRPDSIVIAVVSEVSIQDLSGLSHNNEGPTAGVDLVGEIRTDPQGHRYFRRGVTFYPTIGDPIAVLAEDDLALVYSAKSSTVLHVGSLHQYAAVPASVDADDMLGKHFALLGTTGVGKSSGVVVLLMELLRARKDLRVFLIDAHNEYGECFGEQSETITPKTFRLPFWLFNFEEFLEVIFRGRPQSDDEIEILSELIPEAKRAYADTASKDDPGASVYSVYSVDTPTPYRLQDMLRLMQDRMGKLENQSSRSTYRKLYRRLESVSSDVRYGFIFDSATAGGDRMADLLKQLFPPPQSGRRMTVMQLAGFPAEVTDTLVSVLGRMAFDLGLWSDGAAPLLFVCEEAHRYAPAKNGTAVGPTQRAIGRIAKEGRKYGVSLGLVSQRPAELDQTILSQCSTFFVMRLANEADQAIIRAAVSDAGASALSFVPSLGTREVFAFGEGVKMPTRLEFKRLAPENRPSADVGGSSEIEDRAAIENLYEVVVSRWRGASAGRRAEPQEGGRVQRPLDPSRYRLLKKTAVGLGDESV